MRIKHVFLQNFCKFHGANVLEVDFYKRTEISGVNEIGKSTIKKAIQWVFGCRDENGREITGVRPHDKDGNDFEGDITAEVTVEIEGKDKILKKVCRKNFNKKGEFNGNVTDYYVNNIPKKASDFESFLEENICEKEKLSFCINAMTLLLKGGTDQRAILADMFGQHSNDDICNQFPEFEALRTVLQDGTVDELKKRCNTQLYGTRGRNGIKGLQDLLDEIPNRIDEVSRQKVDIDLAELELQKKALQEKLSENERKIVDTEENMADYNRLSDGVLELKFQLSNLQNKANEDLRKKREEKKKKISDESSKKKISEYKVKKLNGEIESIQIGIETAKKERETLKKEWETSSTRKFDENSLYCPYCGQHYGKDKAKSVEEDFEKHKAEELKKLEIKGKKLRSQIESDTRDLEEKREELQKEEELLAKLQNDFDSASRELESMDDYIDVSGTEEYKAIQKQIAQKESDLNKYSDMKFLREELKEKSEEFRNEIAELDRKIASVRINEKVDKRIAELEQERRNIAQKITDVQAQLDLLKRFSRKKNELLEFDVNKYLCFCTVQMFRTLVNGDTEECCDFTYRGEPYSRNMNHGARILTEIDICNAFQKRCGVELPIMVDDTESLDPWKIPDVDSQLIMFRRSDDASLKVEEAKNGKSN